MPDSRNFAPASGDTLPAALREALERLFRAMDADDVLRICETALDQLGLRGTLHWLPPAGEVGADPGRVILATDPQTQRILIMQAETAPPNAPGSTELA